MNVYQNDRMVNVSALQPKAGHEISDKNIWTQCTLLERGSRAHSHCKATAKHLANTAGSPGRTQPGWRPLCEAGDACCCQRGYRDILGLPSNQSIPTAIRGGVTGSTAAWGHPGSSTMGCSARTTSAVPPTLFPDLSRGSRNDSGDSGRSCSAHCRSESRQCLSIFIIPFAIVGLGPQT